MDCDDQKAKALPRAESAHFWELRAILRRVFAKTPRRWCQREIDSVTLPTKSDGAITDVEGKVKGQKSKVSASPV